MEIAKYHSVRSLHAINGPANTHELVTNDARHLERRRTFPARANVFAQIVPVHKVSNADGKLGFRLLDFDDQLFEHIIARKGELVSWEEQTEKVDSRAGIVHKIRIGADSPFEEHAACENDTFQGMKRFWVTYTEHDGAHITRTISVVVKVKQGSQIELQQTVEAMYLKKGPHLKAGSTMHAWCLGLLARDATMFDDIQDKRFTQIMPELLYSRADASRGHFLLAMQDLREIADPRGDAEQDNQKHVLPSLSDDDVATFFDAIAGFHSVHYGSVGMDKLRSYRGAEKWLQFHDGEYVKKDASEACAAMFDYVAERNPEKFEPYGPNRIAFLTTLFHQRARPIFERIAALREGKRWFTLTHNDCSTRNGCMRKGGGVVLYDWELASEGLPVFDFVEFLVMSTAPDQLASRGYQYYIDSSYKALRLKLTPAQLVDMPSVNEWKALWDLSVSRFVLARYIHFAFFQSGNVSWDEVTMRAHINCMNLLTDIGA